MAEQSVAPTATAQAYSDDQLHARACIVCGTADGGLLSAGHVKTPNRPGEHLVWAVAACPGCQLWGAPC
jgi:hypothetical protein